MHQPVLIKEVIKYLKPESGENFIDCTIGFSGHALSIFEKIKPNGKILGIELDKAVLEKINFQKNLILVHGNFADLKEIVKKNNFYPVNGILFDLGVSSWHFDESNRGFSFKNDELLDMRLDSEKELTAKKIVNELPEEELIKIFKGYGEERYSKSIAGLICKKRGVEEIKTTSELVNIIEKAVPGRYRHGRLHFATRVFQAIRIAVNDELNNLTKALPQALEILEPEGRLVVISFHSLEDRIVKNFFREQAKEEQMQILTKKPIMPNQDEIDLNPRSRSAKLRAAQKIKS